MSTPITPEPKFFEHKRYGDFLASLGSDTVKYMILEASPEEKQERFSAWLETQDFKDLVPVRVLMSEEEWNWFKAKVDAAEDHLPNLKALAKHPPAGFKDLH